ncbi:MAG: GreA/GreB family elongation factor [Marinirhabdus sp.]|nr:GreA/GreB family elongation factor [Marinirhabdus sp.]
MSRGFVKEDDQEETPIIPPRAALPAGVTNYVTPFGLEQLQAERKQIAHEMTNIPGTDDQQRRRDRAVWSGKLQLLEERIASARVLDPKDQDKDQIRFGAHVTLKMNGQQQAFQIVGVDEASVTDKKIAFVAPIARAITGASVGDTVEFKLGDKTIPITILGIRY